MLHYNLRIYYGCEGDSVATLRVNNIPIYKI